MANAGATAQARGSGFQLDAVRRLWRLLTSVRFALGLIAFLAFASLAGVLIPQVPAQMRGNPAAVGAWLQFERGKFGFLTTPMDRLGLFDVFHSLWFAAGLALLVVSIGVCTAGRLGPIWRNVFRPQTRVPDDYLERGPATASVLAPDTEALAAALRRRRYRVSLTREADATYVFADRFPWSQLATFVSHLALVLFVAGGFVTVMLAQSEQVFIGEGTETPVFGITDPKQLQVHVDQAIGRFDAQGTPLDYRTSLVVYQGGREVAHGVTTVSHPLRWGGYTFHQTAYFGDGAALRVRDVATDRTLADDVIPLDSATPAARIVVRDSAGAVLLSDTTVPTDFLQGVNGTAVRVPGTDRQLWVGVRQDTNGQAWQLVAFDVNDTAGASPMVVNEGQSAELQGLTLTFAGVTPLPSAVLDALPGTTTPAVAEMSDGPAGKVLNVGPVQGQVLALSEGQPLTIGGMEYTFEGQRAFAGITVRRDPGTTFIWIATGLLLLGLALTFYLPRRRLWGKIAGGQAAFRGLGGRAAAIEREILEVSRRAETAGAAPESGV